ncbi:alpha/beta fold hydrolase [Streptomyces vilmorinianum]|uniref:alpha/beta fold hydrolase n=1 Tax=Streptomyces vilmorinianum TaxID=3051092 RepID=UPI0015867967|nr:alpha/beta hydrolase [Streptomyces vilmorinianum]
MTTTTLSVAEVLELCQPLLGAAAQTLRVFPVGERAGEEYGPEAVARCNEVLAAIGSSYGLTVPRFVSPAPDRPSSLEVALSTYCDLEMGSWRPVADSSGEWVRSAGGPAGLASLPGRRRIEAEGVPAFDAFSAGPAEPAGPAGDEAIVLVLPSGVPAALFRPWLEELSTDRLVITYENPYLFGSWRSLDTPEGDFAEETALAGALLTAYGLRRAHLVGICGGAPVALAAAAEFGDRVETLTVLHPDLNFGEGVMRTPFQKQFQSVLAGAASGPGRARETLNLFLDPNMLFGVEPRLAPFILYPYGDVELFHRYAKQNYALMAYDANQAARRIHQRVLIATSRTDRMTHPETAHHFGSLVAGEVTVAERESGTHHDILIPDQEIYTMIRAFIGGGRA